MRNITLSLLSGTALAIVATGPVWAEQSPTTGGVSEIDTIETVVVTAQRRAENIQKTPVAVTALSGDEVRKQNVQTAVDLQNFAPSLNVSSSVNRDDNVYVIRGQGPTSMSSASNVAGGGSGVVAYFAETPDNGSGPGLYYDLESIQVVNGPQGTLFGKNTTGGVVLFTPRKPTNEFEGYLEAGGGDYSLWTVGGALNIPVISDKLMIRLSGERYERDGFTIDRGPYFPGKDYDNRNYWNARLGIVFHPIEAIENYTILNVLHSSEHGPGVVLSGYNASFGGPDNYPPGAWGFLYPGMANYFAEQQAAGPRSTSFSDNQLYNVTSWGAVNTTQWFINDKITFKNIFSYKERRQKDSYDTDATPFVQTDLTGAPAGRWHLQTGTITEELQLQGTSLGGDLQWTTGAYYEYGHSIGPQPYDQMNAYFLPLGPIQLIQANATNSERSYGVYAQTTYNFGNIVEALRDLKLTTGYRYNWDNYAYLVGAYIPLAGNACVTGAGSYPASDCALGGKGRSSAQTWTVGLDYQLTEDTMAYVRSARGYLPGGFNIKFLLVPGGASLPQFTYKPESVINFELGAKSQFTLGTMPVLLNAAIFHSDFNNMHRTALLNAGGLSIDYTANASQSVIEGLELQGTVIPFSGMKIGGTYSYNTAHYTKLDPALAPTLVDAPFGQLPMHKASVIANYLLPLSSKVGDVSLMASYSYQSKFFAAARVQPQDYIDGYGLVNLGVNWDRVMGSSWSASFMMTNATDKLYRVGTNLDYFTMGEVSSMYGEPRMFNFKLRYDFGGSNQ